MTTKMRLLQTDDKLIDGVDSFTVTAKDELLTLTATRTFSDAKIELKD